MPRVKHTGLTPLDLAILRLEDDPQAEGEVEDQVRYYRANPEAFFADHLRIRTKNDGLVPFRLNRPQKLLLERWVLPTLRAGKPVRIYILKARQMGFSTLSEALVYWRTTLWPYSNGLVAAHSRGRAATIFNMFRVYYTNVPRDLRPAQKLSNRQEFLFANPDQHGEPGIESYIATETAENPDLGAGHTWHIVHMSEFARYERVNPLLLETWASLMPAIPAGPNTYVILETTAQGEGFAKDFWYTDNGYTKAFIPWVAEPHYRAEKPLRPDDLLTEADSEFGNELLEYEHVKAQLLEWWEEEMRDPVVLDYEVRCRLSWRRKQIKENFNEDISLFDQEYPITPEHAFRASGDAVFNTGKITRMEDHIQTPRHYDFVQHKDVDKCFFAKYNGPLRVYAPPIEGHQYIIGADPAGGFKESDNSCITVMDRETCQIVAVWQHKTDPETFSYVVNALARRYNKAFTCVEANNHGLLVLHNLTKVLKYPSVRLYRRWAYDQVLKKNSWVVGFVTSTATKPMIIHSLRDAIMQDAIHIPDAATLEELKGYQRIERGTKELFEAPVGKKDDLVISTALCWHASLQTEQMGKVPVRVRPRGITLDAAVRRQNRIDARRRAAALTGSY